MSLRTTIMLDTDAAAFLEAAAHGNRSAFINQLLKEEKRRKLAQAVARANAEEAALKGYGESALWDSTLRDGLE